MKKLLLGAIVVFSSILSTQAQTTILAQPFGTNTIPGGWGENTPAIAADNWKFNNAFGTNMANYVGNQGYCTFVDDWDNNPSQTTPNWDTLKGPSMNCSAYTKVFISLNYMFWQDDGNETGTVAISTNGGATWTTAINFPNTGGGWVNGAIYDISSFAASQANVMVAFTYYDGFATATNGYVAVGMAVQNVTIYSPADYNVQVATQNLAPLMQVGQPYIFSGTADNLGGSTVTSMQMNYYVNTPSNTVSQTVSTSGFSSLTATNWSMNTSPFTPAAAGTYTVKYWANPLNGSNTNINTDTLVATFWAVDSVKPRISVLEEFTGQSCVYCMLAAPNCDSVYDNNANNTSMVRYHVPIPARDFMYEATTTWVNPRETYYSVNAAPEAWLDGTSINPSGYLNPPVNQRYSSTTVQADNAIGSPMKIDITKSQFDATTDSFLVTANITSYATFSAGLTAQVALTIDSITYKQDLSMDDPQISFAPPVGTGASGYSYTNCPDYFYDFVLKFTHVVEAMLPNSSGTSLAAFTPGQTQTVNLKWKKTHPWGLYDRGAARDSDFYDSSATGQFVVFVQTNSAIAADGIPAKYIFQSAHAPITGITTVGMQEISSGVFFEMYPNPTTGNTNLAFKLDKDQNVNVELYNMLGEKISTMNEGSMSAGSHTIIINGSALQNGVYFVRFNSDNATTTQKLIIQK